MSSNMPASVRSFRAIASCVVLLVLLGCVKPAGVPAPAAPAANLEADLSAWMQQVGVEQAVLSVARNGRVSQSFGIGRIPQTPYPMASLSKAITAICLDRALSASKHSWDSPLSDLGDTLSVRNLAPSAAVQDLTLANFATHTTGIAARVTQGNGASSSLAQFTQKRLAKAALERPENQSAKRKHRYSNANYAVLGEIIEGITGQSYEDYCKSAVLEPARAMNASVTGTMHRTGAFGGWLMSTEDYARFASHWFAPSRPWIRTKEAYPFDPAFGYGMGVITSRIDASSITMHGGKWAHPDPDLRHGSLFMVAPNGKAIVVAWQGAVPDKDYLKLMISFSKYLR